MSTFIHSCAVCGAESGLEVILVSSVEDADVRRLVADVVTMSLSLGSDVLRYLALHKPHKQRLRTSKVRDLLAELVPDIRRGAITRAGREWAVPPQAWRAGFEAVHVAHAAGKLALPLDGLGYLYAVLMRQADQAEGRRETGDIQGHRAGASRIGRPALLIADDPMPAATAPAPALVPVGLPVLPDPAPLTSEHKARLARVRAESAIKNLGATPKQPQKSGT